MSHRRWEKACHRCGKCCRERVLLSDALVYTGKKCKYLREDGLCSVYRKRRGVNPGCIEITLKNIETLGLPDSCGLLRLARNLRDPGLNRPAECGDNPGTDGGQDGVADRQD